LANGLKNIVSVDVEPYHSIGAAKRAQMGYGKEIFTAVPPDKKIIDTWIARISAHTRVCVKQA
jgi:hypothetical protein